VGKWETPRYTRPFRRTIRRVQHREQCMNTLLLNPDTWDLMLDSNGNIAVASNPYSISQDVASACKLIKGELWYNTAKGIPYFDSILGQRPSQQAIKKFMTEAAFTVSGVAQAQVSFIKMESRNLTLQLQVVDTDGVARGITL